jgi:hypothetical protein
MECELEVEGAVELVSILSVDSTAGDGIKVTKRHHNYW